MDKKIILDNYKRKEIYLQFLNESHNTICVSGEFDITRIFKYSKRIWRSIWENIYLKTLLV